MAGQSEGNFVTGAQPPAIDKDLLKKLNKIEGIYTFKGTIVSANPIKEGSKLLEYRIDVLGDRKVIGYVPVRAGVGPEEIEIEAKFDQTYNKMEAWLQRAGKMTAQDRSEGKGGKGSFKPKSQLEILSGPLAVVIGDCLKVSKGDLAAFDSLADRALTRFHAEVSKLRA